LKDLIGIYSAGAADSVRRRCTRLEWRLGRRGLLNYNILVYPILCLLWFTSLLMWIVLLNFLLFEYWFHALRLSLTLHECRGLPGCLSGPACLPAWHPSVPQLYSPPNSSSTRVQNGPSWFNARTVDREDIRIRPEYADFHCLQYCFIRPKVDGSTHFTWGSICSLLLPAVRHLIKMDRRMMTENRPIDRLNDRKCHSLIIYPSIHCFCYGKYSSAIRSG
jgi:hypothetical protein